jgi:hypothetical protein
MSKIDQLQIEPKQEEGKGVKDKPLSDQFSAGFDDIFDSTHEGANEEVPSNLFQLVSPNGEKVLYQTTRNGVVVNK